MAQLLSAVTPGTLVKLNENDSPVEFYVSKHDYESGLNGVGRTLLVRKDVPQNGQWNFYNVNTYAGSTIDQWFKGTYKALLDTWVQEAIGTTTFYYTPGINDKTVITLSRAVFALSLTELGGSNEYANIEGSALPIYNILRKTTGVANEQWTRTPVTEFVNSAWTMSSEAIRTCTDTYGYRPCITLPGTLYVRDDGTVSQYAGPAPATIIITPAAIMQGNSVHISWDGVEGADSYILQRKADSGEWTQVYAGALTTYTDTAGSWSTVKYQVCGVFDGTNGAFAQSEVITVLPASSLVISGTDGDLGTITSDISYSVATDTGNPISLTLTVNGAQFFRGSVGTSYASSIPVMDLPTGTNIIVITATVQTSSDPVTVTRTWTYTKAAQTFPSEGGIASLLYGTQPIFPQTLAEAVKAIGGPWGGNLSSALNKLAMAATYAATPIPKYSQVDLNLLTAHLGDIVNLPENGVMVPFYVGSVNYEPTLNTSGARVLLIRKDVYQMGQWNSSGVNTYANSTIDNWFNNTYKSMLDSTVQSQMGTTAFKYTPGNGENTVTTLERAVFALSLTELAKSGTAPGANTEGDTLHIASTLQVAYMNGSAIYQWTRSPHIGNSVSAWNLDNAGNAGNNGTTASTIGYRPCFTLPVTSSATYYVDESGNVHPSQEYTTAGDFYDLWGNVIPTTKITTGKYLGTGTYGSSNANTLTFEFAPKFILILKTPIGSNLRFGYFFPQNGIFFSCQNGYSTTSPSASESSSISTSGNSVSWYYSSAAGQLNENVMYYYVAIG